MTKPYEPLEGGDFSESFIVESDLGGWPNVLAFVIRSERDRVHYEVKAFTVLEFHYMRTGIGDLRGGSIPLDNIYVTREDEFEFWQSKFRSFAESYPDEYSRRDEPVCLEFNSHLFGNRKREDRHDRNTGMLVVCRRVSVTPLLQYVGTRPETHRIPASEE